MISLFKLYIYKAYYEKKYKNEVIPLIKYKWWITLKVINNLIDKENLKL